MSTFSIEMPEKDDKDGWDEFQKFMNELHDSYAQEIKNIAKNLNISDACAGDVWYLRSRSRHTQELENELIKLHKEGNPPNICEFGD